MGGIAEKNNDDAARQTKACFDPLGGVPFNLVANPSIGKDTDYSPPQERWLDSLPAATDRSRTSPPARGRATHPLSRMQRAADFVWTFACPLEQTQYSILQMRVPHAPPMLHRTPSWITRRNPAALPAKDCAQTESIAAKS